MRQPFAHSSESWSETRRALNDGMIREARGGPGVPSQVQALWCQVLTEGSARDSPINILLDDVSDSINERGGIPVEAALSGLRTSIIAYSTNEYLARGEAFHDIRRVKPKDWKEPVAYLVEDLGKQRGTEQSMSLAYHIHAGITFRGAATPPPDRGMPTQALLHMAADRSPEGARVLDVASSIGTSALSLVYGFYTEFKSVHIDSGSKLRSITKHAQNLVNTRVPIEEVVCVDKAQLWTPEREQYDPGYLLHALSGLRPNERADHIYMTRLRGLINRKQKGTRSFKSDSPVKFFEGNFLRPSDLEEFKHKHKGGFNLITADYLTQELSPSERIAMHYILIGLLKEDGILAYKHQMRLKSDAATPTGIEDLETVQDYSVTPYSSYQHVYDAMLPEHGLQETMQAYDNRWRKVRVLGSGALAVGGKPKPITEIIQGR